MSKPIITSPAKAQEFLDRAKAHYAAEMLAQGSYAGKTDDGDVQACSIGCHLIDIHPELNMEEVTDLTEKHRRVAEYYELPEWLVQLEDTVFEWLPEPDNRLWHVQIAQAIVDAGEINWDRVFRQTMVGILRLALPRAGESTAVVQRVIDLYEQSEPVTEREWLDAADAAACAARAAHAAARAARAAYAARAAGAADAAVSAAFAAADAARAAAYAADAAYAAAYAAGAAGAADAVHTARNAGRLEIRDVILKAIADNGTSK